MCCSAKKGSKLRNYRGRHDLLCLESQFSKFNIFSHPLNILYMMLFLDLLLLPLPHSNCILVYRVSLKISCPELANSKCAWHSGPVTVWIQAEIAHFLWGRWAHTRASGGSLLLRLSHGSTVSLSCI